MIEARGLSKSYGELLAVAACCVVLMETWLPRRLNRRLRWLEAEG